MRHAVLAPLALILAAAPALADLNVVYKGTENFTGKEIPAEARYSITRGRVAVLQKGSHSGRMLFDQKTGVLRMVDDDNKTYVDMDRAMLESFQSLAANAKEDMEKGMAQMTPEQRKMVEGMVQSRLQAARPVADEFVRTDETAQIKGYTCTRVNIMRGPEKRAEYWGTPSKDFQMSPEERQTMIDMQAFLDRFVNSMTPLTGAGTSGARGFHWDTKIDGYPIVSRCFDGDRRILDLTMESFNHDAISEDLFRIPDDYKKQDVSGMGRPERGERPERSRKHK
jgi:hypothetical protein